MTCPHCGFHAHAEHDPADCIRLLRLAVDRAGDSMRSLAQRNARLAASRDQWKARAEQSRRDAVAANNVVGRVRRLERWAGLWA